MSHERPLRIHFLTNFVHEQGTYFRFHNLAVGLTQLGQQVTVFGCDNNTTGRPRAEMRDGVGYQIATTARGGSIFGAACHPVTAVRRSCINYPACDVCHLFQPFPSAALSWQKSLRLKSQVRFYDWDDLWSGGFLNKSANFRDAWSKALTRSLENSLPGQADMVTTCSQFLARLACQRNAKQTQVIHNGFWPFQISERATARKQLGLAEESLYVGFMGRTTNELSWCFDAMSENLTRYPRLRLALCGADAASLQRLPTDVRARIDYLGQLTPLQTRDFAAALDIGLLPLEDSAFNQSRFPIKYAEYMAAGTPVLCSEVGECSYLSADMPWVIKAGKTQQEWLLAFNKSLALISEGKLPLVDSRIVEERFSWLQISRNLLKTYKTAISTNAFNQAIRGK